MPSKMPSKMQTLALGAVSSLLVVMSGGFCLADSLGEVVISQAIDQHNADVKTGALQDRRTDLAHIRENSAPAPAASFAHGSMISIASNGPAVSNSSSISGTGSVAIMPGSIAQTRVSSGATPLTPVENRESLPKKTPHAHHSKTN